MKLTISINIENFDFTAEEECKSFKELLGILTKNTSITTDVTKESNLVMDTPFMDRRTERKIECACGEYNIDYTTLTWDSLPKVLSKRRLRKVSGIGERTIKDISSLLEQHNLCW
jgi:hypothetical protein